ncbi:two-component system sporulation sensor kinase A [Bacillus ectoiniformans]|uniref:PAS domain S-box protein n=1 Tax=Bacillus ectoiniformans TaxID=1494429 RepID=UPI00195953E7|nr:PAS domain S-box protein [Bacillus ectoiniformans]MBM7647404.1 two-component system sporulation sensor kinase A [Bacillus ectoiniformans]
MKHSEIIDSDEKSQVHQSVDFIVTIGQGGHLRYANPSFKKWLGTDRDKTHFDWYETIHSDDLANVTDKLDRCRENRSDEILFIRIMNHQGKYRRMIWQFTYNDKDGAYIGIGKEAIKKNTKSFISTFLNTTREALAILSPQGHVIKVNKGFEELYGWKLEEIEGKELPIVPIQFMDEYHSVKEKTMAGSTVNEHQTIRQKKDGTLIYINLSTAPIYNEAGQLLGIIGITRNVTEQVKTSLLLNQKAAELKVNEMKFLEIAENINEIFSVYDVEKKKVIYISPSYERIMGHSVNKIYKDPRAFIDTIHPEDQKECMEFIKGNSQQEIEYRVIHKDGSIKWMRSRVAVKTNSDTPFRLSTITQDITTLKEKEFLLSKRDKLGVVGQLAAGIAHEVRNPLTAVKGFVQILGEETNNKYTQIILSELDRIESIMQEFLLLAKPNQDFFFEKADLNQVIRESVEFLQPEALLYKTELKMDLHNLSKLVRLEKKQIKQVIFNLIKNAIDSMPDGGVVWVKTIEYDEEYVGIQVIDQGLGIAPDRITRLGEPFFSNKEKGTGLGLMVSFKIIENHSGKIFFTSEEGQGTKAEILLPYI